MHGRTWRPGDQIYLVFCRASPSSGSSTWPITTLDVWFTLLLQTWFWLTFPMTTWAPDLSFAGAKGSCDEGPESSSEFTAFCSLLDGPGCPSFAWSSSDCCTRRNQLGLSVVQRRPLRHADGIGVPAASTGGACRQQRAGIHQPHGCSSVASHLFSGSPFDGAQYLLGRGLFGPHIVRFGRPFWSATCHFCPSPSECGTDVIEPNVPQGPCKCTAEFDGVGLSYCQSAVILSVLHQQRCVE